MNITNPNQEIRDNIGIVLKAGGRKKWSDEDSDHVRILRERGYSIRKIGQIMKCGTDKVQQAIKGII